jgi:DNA-binding LacI/PurR family transcriptional regulator
MADVARLAGVSLATVSRALNRRPLVNAETRARIEELARTLSYRINIGAQDLRRGHSRTVGVVMPYDEATRQHLSDPFFLGMLGAVGDALAERGFDMLLSRVHADELDGTAQPYDSGRAGGVILIGQWRCHERLNALAARGVPLVVWGAQLPQQDYCTVGGDNVSGGELATRHLLAGGRRRIAFFGDINLPEVAHRFRGYSNVLRAHGFEPDPLLRVSVPFVPHGGHDGVRELLRRGATFDAIFACSDLLAMTAINELRAHGKSVPDDVAVVGYDDIELACHFHPPLTTVRQPRGDAGREMVARLLDLIDGHAAPSAQLPTQLIIRESGGKA